MRSGADKSTFFSRYLKGCGVKKDKSGKISMSVYGWGLSHSFKYKDGNWSEWWPHGTLFPPGFDHKNANIPNFFRTRRVAENYKLLNTNENSRYRVKRYKITWVEL